MVRKFTLLLSFLFCAVYAGAQKIKYKDLFVLLNARQYDQAEPFLKKYLAETTDNPNAYLFMGMIFQEKSSANDLLKETDKMLANMDSATLFYDKAFSTITVKEIKRNDEYYQAYSRRDLRTGKFGINLSDIQFDLEKRMKSLRERATLTKQLKMYFERTAAHYAKTNFLFKDIKLKHPDFKNLLLRADDVLTGELSLIAATFDSVQTAFNSYQSISQKIGKTGYNQVIDLKEIRNYDTDGTTGADFFEDDLKLWNYKSWAQAVEQSITKEIMPMREQLIAQDVAINKLRDKLKRDSVLVDSEIAEVLNKPLAEQLKKYDNDPMPLTLFAMKIAELNYLSGSIRQGAFKDSADIRLHLGLVKEQLAKVNALDSLCSMLNERNLDEDFKDYHDFVVNAYGTPAVLRSLMKTTKDFSRREIELKQAELKQYEESMKWIVHQGDSVPLFFDPPASIGYRPLILVEEKYTAGFRFTDSLATGYFRTILPSRKQDVSVAFKVGAHFTKDGLSQVKALSASDENGQLFYLLFYSETKVEGKLPVTLTKIYRTDGLAWSNDYACEFPPAELAFDPASGDIAIKTANSAGEVTTVAIDRDGKRKVTDQ